MLSAQALVAAGISTVQRWATDKFRALRTAVTAPDYLVKTSTTTLPAERVVTDTTSNTWDWATAGQAKVKRAALTGDVTAAADTNTTTIANAAVTLAKMANLATDRLIGRDTAGDGAPEALTVGGGVEFTTTGGIQRSALTGDVTAAAGSGSVTVNQARGLRETAGPTTLTVGAIADGQYCKRVGTTIVGGAPTTAPALRVDCDTISAILASSTNSHFERHPCRPAIVRLAPVRTYGTIADAIAVPPTTWTARNSAKAASASASGSILTLTGVSGGGTYETILGTTTAPSFYRSWTRGRGDFRVAFRLTHGDVDGTVTAWQLQDTAGQCMLRLDLYRSGSTRVIRHWNAGTGENAVSVASSDLTGGIWFAVTITDGNVSWIQYQINSATSEPTDSWRHITPGTFSSRLLGYNRTPPAAWIEEFCAERPAGTAAPVASLLGPFATGAFGDLAGPPLLCCRGYAATSDTIALVADAGFSAAVTPSITLLRSRLADAINQLPGDAATWTFGCAGGSSAPSAPTTFQSAGTLILKASGSDTPADTGGYAHWGLWAICASASSVQPASLDTTLIAIEIP